MNPQTLATLLSLGTFASSAPAPSRYRNPPKSITQDERERRKKLAKIANKSRKRNRR